MSGENPKSSKRNREDGEKNDEVREKCPVVVFIIIQEGGDRTIEVAKKSSFSPEDLADLYKIGKR
jgi:hypothetical protein